MCSDVYVSQFKLLIVFLSARLFIGAARALISLSTLALVPVPAYWPPTFKRVHTLLSLSLRVGVLEARPPQRFFGTWMSVDSSFPSNADRDVVIMPTWTKRTRFVSLGLGSSSHSLGVLVK